MKKLFILLSVLGLVSCSERAAQPCAPIPFPNSIDWSAGTFSVAGAPLRCDERIDEATRRIVEELSAALSAATGKPADLTCTSEPESAEGIRFILAPELEEERYTLEVEPHRATLRASSLHGFLYAVQTLKQLLPTAIYGGAPAAEAAWQLPCVRIDDAPRFAYRGLMLDVSRHFFDVREIRRIIDAMAIYKFNTLHWHLTDDQGWRIEIERYPKLAEVGSVRRQTVAGHDWSRYDTTPHGGCYTRDEVREVVSYAAAHGITVIPEIDLPGHMQAALASYPELGCTGGPYEVWGRWGVSPEVLCAGKESTFAFIEGVLTEVLELFPSEYIHIGGDECPKTRWAACPRCQARIRALGLKGDAEYTAEHYLQSYVMARVERFLNERGRRIIGWDEILEGELTANATVMSWRGSEGGIEAARQGHDAIMSPNSHFYFNKFQARDTENEPAGCGAPILLEESYAYEPVPDSLPADLRAHILGVQANLWSEYVCTDQQLEYLLLPRLAALSEVQWCDRGRRDWERFTCSLKRAFDIYDRLGYTYSTAAFGIRHTLRNNPEKGCVELTLCTPDNAPIRYTLDGSDPTESGTRYTRPIEITGACELKAAAPDTDFAARPFTQTFVGNKAIGHAITLESEPLPKYRFGAPESLVDGIRGAFSYANGEWAGWHGSDFAATIDMAGATCRSVTLGTLIQKSEDIFPPLRITVSVSDDGISFTPLAERKIPMAAAADPDGLQSYTVDFAPAQVRYLRIEAQTVASIPSWHGARGRKGFLFVDEIVVQ